MINYQGKNIVIIGLGVTGLSCVDYFLAKNVIPKVIDTRKQPSGIEKLDPKVPCHTGDINLDWVLRADLIVVSPGLPLSTPELVMAKQKNIEIIGDIELFCREVKQLDNKKVVAITGANGKTTVTSLVGEIIKMAGIKVGIGGNIGTPALSLLNQNNDYFVLELSSFQLETTHSLQATVATILNISEDHMDRYPEGLMQYVAAKQRIYSGAEFCVINHDDKLTYPQNNENDQSWVEFALQSGKYHLSDSLESFMIDDVAILSTKDINLLGVHNYLNILSAIAIADKLAISRDVTISAVKQFKGLPHRFELVYENNQVQWINDSKATNVGSTEAALRSVLCKRKLFLLLGGDGKAADFSPLLPYLTNKNIEIYCFGRDKNLLASLKPEISIIVNTMNDAMKEIAHKVQENDVVLLSPACASLDQFKNYMERGDIFTKLAKELG